MALINELYRSFDFFNEYFCQNTLKRPIITIQGDKQLGTTYGWFGKGFWKENTEEGEVTIDELNLTAEALHREPKYVLETLLHEMAHLKNAQEDISDCTSTQYHNEHFKKTAEFFGLVVDRLKGKGWAKTSLDLKATDAIEKLQPKVEIYQIVRTPPTKPKKDPTTISLNVGLEFGEMIEEMAGIYGGKRQMAEEALTLLHKKHKT